MLSRPPAQSCTPEYSKAFKLIIILNGEQNPMFPTEVLDRKYKWENGPSQPACSRDPRSQQKKLAESLLGSSQSSTNNRQLLDYCYKSPIAQNFIG